jgi:PAS domain S-box-containing protein
VDFLRLLFDASDFSARWVCGNWSRGHGWLHIFSDLGVWSAYVAIPCVLGYFLLRRQDLPFRKIFILFVAFILACGTTHLMEAILFWWPAYRLAGLIKLFTAIVSWATVIALIPVVPRVLTMRSTDDLEREVEARKQAEAALQQANDDLEARVTERIAELGRANAALEVEVSERRQAEERVQRVADAVPALISLIGPDACYRLNNRAYETWFGRSRGDLTGKQMRDVLGERAWQAIRPHVEAALAGTVVNYEAEVPYREGGTRWISATYTPDLGEGGVVRGMVAHVNDITQRKRAEHTSRFLADASAALAVLVDFDNTLQKVSSLAVPSFADWATVDLAEADGSLRRVSVSHIDPTKVQLAHEVHRRFPSDPAAPQGVWNILRTGRSEIIPEISDELLVQSVNNIELLGILRDLGLKSYIGVPLTVRGKTLGVITFINAESGHRYDNSDLAVAEDLASRAAIAIENAQLYRELRDADQRKDEFLATLAHELRNPLAPIRNGLQVLRLANADGGMVDKARSMMERQLSQMVRLVDDLLDVSRITRNKLELRKERVSLKSVIKSAVETSHPLIEKASHTFSITLPPTPLYLDADLTRLAQVFSNLLNNAVKYTEPGGRILLNGELSGSEVVVQVQDNGRGIPADALPHIFEMFSQVDRNLERAQGGLGIGLTLVRRLVEMHGGTVEAKSDGQGKGSTFVVRLPVVALPVAIAQERRDEAGARHAAKWKVLVVDDNRDSAESLRMMLTLMGNEVRTAHDGLEAVEAASQFSPDLILMDVGMPRLNGFDATRRIREQPGGKSVRIVVLTGWGQEEDRRMSQEAGCDGHMVKPVDPAALEKLLATLQQDR